MEEEILITVKTYPSISQTYDETVCTAGITKDGKWVRLYPLEYRGLNYDKWFKKYQWIKANIRRNEKDNRPESHRIKTGSIQLGPVLEPKRDKWLERKKYVLPVVVRSMEEILDRFNSEKVSLAAFKPKQVKKFLIERDSEDWRPEQKMKLLQLKLFGNQPKDLEKVPYKFSYEFVCDDPRCRGHTMSIHDWEIYQLYRTLRVREGGAIDIILSKIKQKFFDQMWSAKRDSYLFVGSVYPKPSFIVLGVFWPPAA